MPRKEGPPIEERMQRAKELYEFKQFLKQKNLKELYASPVYKFARVSSIVFLCIAQLILIDWILPDKISFDKVTTSNFNSVIRPNKELFVKSESGFLYQVEFPQGTLRPSAGDSIVVYKSLLLHDIKKIGVPAVKETYLVTTALTYRFFALLLIGVILTLCFVFIKNIEVKAFGWIVGIYAASTSLFFAYCIISSFL
ncbi:MAG: hypothetical protein ACXVPN_09295 [Bacteroidia bacterium]